MCGMCELQFKMDHEGLPCGIPSKRCACGRFDIDVESEQCYHCFAKAADLDPCPTCPA